MLFLVSLLLGGFAALPLVGSHALSLRGCITPLLRRCCALLLHRSVAPSLVCRRALPIRGCRALSVVDRIALPLGRGGAPLEGHKLALLLELLAHEGDLDVLAVGDGLFPALLLHDYLAGRGDEEHLLELFPSFLAAFFVLLALLAG